MLHDLMEVLAANSPIHVLPEIVVILTAGAIIAYISQRLGQVPIVGFLLAGVLIGPNALGLVQDQELIEVVAEIGIILLLFTIGIEFSLEKLARIKRLIFVGGGLQVGLTVLLTTMILATLGIDLRVGIFTGCLIALSSTAIILKLLADRAETNSEPGQIALGILIFQDLAVIVMVLLVPMLAGIGGSPLNIVWELGKAAAIIALVLIFARRVMPPLLEIVARTCSQEIFLLSVIAICFGTAWLTSLAGVSLSLGAFLAGLVVSESQFSEHAFGEIMPLQVLFSAAFFVSVGLLLDLGFLLAQPLLVLSVLVGIVLIKVITSGIGVLLLGYPLRTALLSGFLLAQVGEFAFVLERAARPLDLFPLGLAETGGQTFIAASVILLVMTPFLSQTGYWVRARLTQRETTSLAEAAATHTSTVSFAHLQHHVIVAGYGAGAQQLVRVLRGSGIPYVILTLNPLFATEAEREGLPVLRADDSRLHTLQMVGIERAKLLVIADDNPGDARRVAAVARTANPTLSIIVRTRYIAEAASLTEAGADIVIPEELESTVQLFVQVLDAYRVAPPEIETHVQSMRAHGYTALRERADQPPVVCTDLDEECMQTRIVTIRAGAPAAGRPLDPQALQREYGLQVEAVQRNGQTIHDLPETLELQPGDRLVLLGNTEQFMRSGDLFRVSVLPGGTDMPGATRTPAEQSADGACTHLNFIRPVSPESQGCAECQETGDTWVHLRICLTCGHVGCCDSSKNQHATKHFHASGHPIIQSFEPGESWRWCYIDKTEV
jgi:CPA2 family monovalent cation:H+ antiporter-2